VLHLVLALVRVVTFYCHSKICYTAAPVESTHAVPVHQIGLFSVLSI
jgi:hypothetical protein